MAVTSARKRASVKERDARLKCVNLRLDPDLHTEATLHADASNESLQAFIRRALRDRIQRNAPLVRIRHRRAQIVADHSQPGPS